MADFLKLSRFHNSQRGQAAAMALLTYNRILRIFNESNAFELGGTNNHFRPVNPTGNTQSRALGGGFIAGDITPEEQVNFPLRIHGSSVNVDVSHVADMENGINGLNYDFEQRLKEEIIAFARSYEILLMKGDGLTNNIAGLRTILNGDDLPGFPGISRVISAAEAVSSEATSLDISLSLDEPQFRLNANIFLELLEYALTQVDDSQDNRSFLLSPSMFSRMTTIGRIFGLIDTNTSLFGVPIPTFNQIPMVKLGKNTITDDEPELKEETPDENTTSIYIVSPGELEFSIVTNSGLEYWEHKLLETKQSGEEKWEVRAAFKMKNPEKVMRIRHIKAIA